MEVPLKVQGNLKISPALLCFLNFRGALKNPVNALLMKTTFIPSMIYLCGLSFQFLSSSLSLVGVNMQLTFSSLFTDRFLAVGSRDMTACIFSLFPVKNFTPVTLSGHRNTVRGCYFEENSLNVSFWKSFVVCGYSSS